MSQKLHQRLSRLFWIFLKYPMSGVFEDNHCGIGSYNLHLLPEYLSICLLAADRQHRDAIRRSPQMIFDG